MAPLKPALPALSAGWLASRFELSRGGAGNNLLSMEGLRGLAVFLVFLVHFGTLAAPWMAPGGLSAALFSAGHAIGHAGVDLFFVLSGFLIYGHLIESPRPFGTYFGRRVKRVYPTFLAMFALYLVLSLLRPQDSKLPDGLVHALTHIGANLLLLPGILPIEPMITVAWSLSYEMFYYLVVPAVIAVAGLRERTRAWRIAFFLGVALSGALAAAVFGGPVRLLMFLAGIVLHELLRSFGARAPGGVLGVLALAAGLAAMLLPLPGPALQALRTLWLCACFLVLCWSCFGRPQGALARCFTWTPLRWLGNMSYSYYLMHGLVLKAFFMGVAAAAPGWLGADLALVLLLPAFAATLVVSAGLFLAVEHPFSLAARPRPATDAPAGGPAWTPPR